MTSLRDLLGIKVGNPFGHVWIYSCGGHELGSWDPWKPGTFLDYEMDHISLRSEYEAWLVDMLVGQFLGVLPPIVAAGENKPYVRKVRLPFYMHYSPVHTEERDCE